MPPVSLTLHQKSAPTSVDGVASYAVTNEVVAATGIDSSVFVFRTDTGKFSHYATVLDMDSYPTSQVVAVANNAAFFRLASVTRAWPTISAMNTDLAMTRARLNGLAREMSQVQGTISVDQTIVIEAS